MCYNKVVDLDLDNYHNFMKTTPLFILTICSNDFTKYPKCKDIKEILSGTEKDMEMINVEMQFAYIDMQKYKDIADEWMSDKIPTIYYINEEEKLYELYSGKPQRDKLFQFLKKKLYIQKHNVKNEIELVNYIKTNSLKKSILFLNRNKNNTFINVTTVIRAARHSSLGIKKIFLTESEELFNKYNIPEGGFDLVLYSHYKKKNETISEQLKVHEFGMEEFSRLNLKAIIYKFGRKLYGKLHKNDYSKAIGIGTPTLFFIHANQSSELESQVERLAKERRTQLWVLHGNYSNSHVDLLRSYFKISEQDLPFFIYTQNNPKISEDVEKYVLKGKDINFNKLEKFVDDVEHRRVERYITYNKILPTTSEFHIKSLNGLNFISTLEEELKLQNEVVILLCPLWSKKLPRINVRLERVKVKLFNNPKLKFFYIDPLLNEVDYIRTKYYPTIAFIKNSLSHNNIYTIDRNMTTRNITNFIKNNSQFNFDLNFLSQEDYIDTQELQNPLKTIKRSKFEEFIYAKKGVELFPSAGLRRLWKYMEYDRGDFIHEVFNYGNKIKREFKDPEELDNYDENEYLKNTEL
jgi:hypothetical protein